MNTKTNPLGGMQNSDGPEIVSWSDIYVTKIELIDSQHRELLNLTNELYRACLSGSEKANVVFKDAMSRMVDYVRFHFTTEQKLLEKVKFPDYADHKKKHEVLIKNILDAVKDHGKGAKFVPNNFVRTLKDWILGHIAVFDKAYSMYIHDLKKKGLITDQDLKV